MTARITAAFDVGDPARSGRFWAALLDRRVEPQPDGVLLPGTERQVGLRFTRADRPPTGRPRSHLHLTSETPADQDRLVAQALELGGRHHDVGQGPDDGFVVLADPEGVELCVIDAGNAYLAGTGPLGEVAGEGSRAVGEFWSAALGWPLVWDQDEETVVQLPSGGTKVAWGGPAETPLDGRRSRERLEVQLDGDLAEQAARLVALGATEQRRGAGVVELTNPDGQWFVLRGRPA